MNGQRVWRKISTMNNYGVWPVFFIIIIIFEVRGARLYPTTHKPFFLTINNNQGTSSNYTKSAAVASAFAISFIKCKSIVNCLFGRRSQLVFRPENLYITEENYLLVLPVVNFKKKSFGCRRHSRSPLSQRWPDRVSGVENRKWFNLIRLISIGK